MGTIPIIGICRGLQLINVQCGGTLWQHDFFIKYSQHDNDLVDYIKTDSGNFRANSFHHQHIQRLGAGLKVLARDRFLRIEAIENPKRKLFAVQWHPERMINEKGQYYDHFTINHICKLLGVKV
jgi:putative glutamine amidotransferase